MGSLIIAFGGGGGRGSEFTACSTFLSGPPFLVELRELSVVDMGELSDEVFSAGIAATWGFDTCSGLLLTSSSLTSSPVSGLMIRIAFFPLPVLRVYVCCDWGFIC